MDTNEFFLSYICENPHTFTIVDCNLPTIDILREELQTSRKKLVSVAWHKYLNYGIFATSKRLSKKEHAIVLHKIKKGSYIAEDLNDIEEKYFSPYVIHDKAAEEYDIKFIIGDEIPIQYLDILKEGISMSIRNYNYIVKKFTDVIVKTF